MPRTGGNTSGISRGGRLKEKKQGGKVKGTGRENWGRESEENREKMKERVSTARWKNANHCAVICRVERDEESKR